MDNFVHKAVTGKSEEPYASPPGMELSDFASESVIVSDARGVIKYWNAASEALYGWPALATVGQNYRVLNAHGNDEGEPCGPLFKEDRWEGVVRRRHLTGAEVTVAVRRFVRRDPAGKVLDVVEFGRNAQASTEATMMRMDAELQGSLAACWELDTADAQPLLDNLAGSGASIDFDRHSEWVGDVLAATRIVAVNDRAVRMFGAHATREQMLGRPVSSFWPGEGRAVLASILDSIIRDRSRLESRRLDGGGTIRDATVRAWRLGQPGQPNSQNTVFVTLSGATNDDRTAWELQASEERYRKLMQYLPTALWQVDSRRVREIFERLRTAGVKDISAHLDQHPELVRQAREDVRVTDVNREAVSLFRANNAADLIGPLGEMFTATPGLAKRIMVAHFEGQRNFIEEARVRTFDGTIIDVLLTVTFPVPPEQLDMTFLTMQDISHRLSTAKQLRKLQADFTHAGRIATLGELATSIAHEVNQPLAAIVTNGETSLRWLSRDDKNIEKVTQLTSRIVASARHASEIIRRIRGMASKNEPEKQPVCLNGIVEEAILFVRHEVDLKSIVLSAALAPDVSPVMGDRIQLQQVIINLLVNSVQAVSQSERRHPWIDVRTSVDDNGRINLSVRDNGPGIAEGHVEQIFDSFFSTKDSGLGIGLAICHSIVTAHGGTISGSNHPDGGAHFQFSLPRI